MKQIVIEMPVLQENNYEISINLSLRKEGKFKIKIRKQKNQLSCFTFLFKSHKKQPPLTIKNKKTSNLNQIIIRKKRLRTKNQSNQFRLDYKQILILIYTMSFTILYNFLDCFIYFQNCFGCKQEGMHRSFKNNKTIFILFPFN